MQYQKEKFANAILFFAQNTDPKKLGRVKLVKLFFFADFLHFEKYGRPITGDVYYHLPEGPVPTTSYDLFRDTFDKHTKTGLEKYIKISPEKIGSFTIDKIEPLRKCNENVFSESDIEILKKVSERFYSETGTNLARMTHDIPFVKNTPQVFPIDYLDAIENENDKIYLKELQKEDCCIESALSE